VPFHRSLARLFELTGDGTDPMVKPWDDLENR